MTKHTHDIQEISLPLRRTYDYINGCFTNFIDGCADDGSQREK
jgi:hypothetical protein